MKLAKTLQGWRTESSLHKLHAGDDFMTVFTSDLLMPFSVCVVKNEPD